MKKGIQKHKSKFDVFTFSFLISLFLIFHFQFHS